MPIGHTVIIFSRCYSAAVIGDCVTAAVIVLAIKLLISRQHYVDCVKRGTTFGDRTSLELNMEDPDELSEETEEEEEEGDEVGIDMFLVCQLSHRADVSPV